MSKERKIGEISPIRATDIDHVLVGYLLDSDGMELSGVPFPSHFDFAWCKPAMEQMYSETKLVSILNEAEKTATRRESQRYLTDPAYTDMQDILGEVHLMEEEERGAGERTRIVFAVPSPSNGSQVEFGPITHGEYRQVKSGSVIPGRLPLLRMHTHPYNALFSPQDYIALITDMRARSGLRKRLFYAEMVICPNMQALALASSATPLFPDEEAEKYVHGAEQNFNERFKAQWQLYGISIGDSEEAFLTMLKSNRGEFLVFVRSLRTKITKDEISTKERRRLIEEFFLSHGEAGQRIIESERRIREIRNRIYNAELVEVARSLNIKLYTSTNMKDFYAASA